MKTRTGFVSNSSSSSYVVLVEKEAYDKLFAQLSDLERDIVQFLQQDGGGVRKFMGGEVVVMQYVSGNYSTLEDYSPGDGGVMNSKAAKDALEMLEKDDNATYGDVEPEDGDEVKEPYEIWDEIEEKIDALPKGSFLKFSNDF